MNVSGGQTRAELMGEETGKGQDTEGWRGLKMLQISVYIERIYIFLLFIFSLLCGCFYFFIFVGTY
jgi:hypothetical protein